MKYIAYGSNPEQAQTVHAAAQAAESAESATESERDFNA